jgi:hypothetical protein
MSNKLDADRALLSFSTFPVKVLPVGLTVKPFPVSLVVTVFAIILQLFPVYPALHAHKPLAKLHVPLLEQYSYSVTSSLAALASVMAHVMEALESDDDIYVLSQVNDVIAGLPV